jgi:alpha-beta hydrolase superfamily lysophospholipase
VTWLWVGLGLLVLAVVVPLYLFHLHIFRRYLPYLYRIFQEKPLFIIPIGQPIPSAEEVQLATTHGLTLHGCYLKASGPRRGVILFGLEYGSNCWSCGPYCEFLRENGYDIFAFETRGQGTSLPHDGYEPLQWVTTFEIEDFRAALSYLKQRADADPRGVGFFGLSKGGSAGLFLAAEDPFIRCCAVDGIFSTYTTMVPYMMKWVAIFTNKRIIIDWLPKWYFYYAAFRGLQNMERERHCCFPSLERVIHRIAPRPMLMVHGSADTYIKPEMAQKLFGKARKPKEFWLVDGAKHNQSIVQAEADYKKRILGFFDQHLGENRAEIRVANAETSSIKGMSKHAKLSGVLGTLLSGLLILFRAR